MATRTHCPYCAFQCGMKIERSADGPVVSGDPAFPVNRGRLCVKGFTSAATLGHRERLTRPLVRGRSGELMEATWDEALDRVATGVRGVQQRYGRDGVGVYGSGALTNEKA